MSGIVPNGVIAPATATAAPSNRLPHVPARWARYDTDLSSVLAFAPRGAPLEIVRITDEGAEAYCARVGLAAGDRITRFDGRNDDVVVTTDDGRRVRVDLPIALLIEVQPALPS